MRKNAAISLLAMIVGVTICAAPVQAQWVQSGANTYYNKGNVGVGTTAPGAKLDVTGAESRVMIRAWNTAINNAASDAALYLRTEKGGGDALLFLGLQGVTNWFVGADRSDGSKLKIGATGMSTIDTGKAHLTIDQSGKVGIGATIPLTRFHLKGSTAQDAILFMQPSEWNSVGDYSELRFGDTNHYIRGEYQTGMTLYDANKFQFMGGNVGIKTANPQAALHVNGNARFDGYRTYFGLDGSKHHWLALNKGNETSNLFMAFTSNDGIQAESVLIAPKGISGLIVRATGNVGIGTYDPGSYRLAVNGTIRAKEVIVNTGWADFVFKQDYQLMPLNEVEERIKADKHLPGIPSAKEIEANGVSVGDMQAKQLQKIEELTLYMIEMNKQLAAVQQENARLSAELLKLQQARQ